MTDPSGTVASQLLRAANTSLVPLASMLAGMATVCVVTGSGNGRDPDGGGSTGGGTTTGSLTVSVACATTVVVLV
jgi:hypothetical protein